MNYITHPGVCNEGNTWTYKGVQLHLPCWSVNISCPQVLYTIGKRIITGKQITWSIQNAVSTFVYIFPNSVPAAMKLWWQMQDRFRNIFINRFDLLLLCNAGIIAGIYNLILTNRKIYIKYKIYNIRNNNKLCSIEVELSWSLANFAIQVFSVQIFSVQIFSVQILSDSSTG